MQYPCALIQLYTKLGSHIITCRKKSENKCVVLKLDVLSVLEEVAVHIPEVISVIFITTLSVAFPWRDDFNSYPNQVATQRLVLNQTFWVVV